MSWLWNRLRKSATDSSPQQKIWNSRLLTATTSDTASIFRRSRAVQRQPGETRLIPGVIGQSSAAHVVSRPAERHKRPLGGSASSSNATKRVKRTQDTGPDQNPKSFEEDERRRSKKRKQSSLAKGVHISRKRARYDSTNPKKGTAIGVVEDNVQGFAEEQSLDELSKIRCDQELGVDVCSRDAEQNQSVEASGFAVQRGYTASTKPGTNFETERDYPVDVEATAQSLQDRLALLRLCLNRTSRDGATVQSNIGPGSWKLESPNDYVVGVGGWHNSHQIPGQSISYDPEPDVIEFPKTRIRKRLENQPIYVCALRKPSGGSTVATIRLPPLFSPSKTNARQVPISGTKHSAASATQISEGSRRMRGIWNRSVGNPVVYLKL